MNFNAAYVYTLYSVPPAKYKSVDVQVYLYQRYRQSQEKMWLVLEYNFWLPRMHPS